MNRAISFVFSYIPMFEVFFRHLLIKKKTRIAKFKKKNSGNKTNQIDKAKLFNFIDSQISAGDIVIMHTRMSYIKRFGLSPHELINYILNILGNDGTLFVPNMPFYDSFGAHKYFDKAFDEILIYDKAKTNSWTGVVGDIFVKDYGAKRSDSPYCSLAGLGPFVDDAFCEELSDGFIFGPKSSWYKIMTKRAKILFLGAEAYDSITEAHLIEDNHEIFKRNGWHIPVKFDILHLNKKSTIHIRKNYWNRYLSEFYNIRILKKHNLIKVKNVNGVELSCIHDFKDLYSFYSNSLKRNKMPLFMGIPKKNLKL